MKPERKSHRLLGVTRSKAKMIEYQVPEKYQKIDLSLHPERLFTVSIGLLGDFAAAINRGELDSDSLSKMKANLIFSAHFFNSYFESKLNKALDPYLLLLGSASYYLCDLPGSASVLTKSIGNVCPDLDGAGLENLLLWLLRATPNPYDGDSGLFASHIDKISLCILQFYKDGTGEEKILDLARELRSDVYEYGTPRQLLLGDVIVAVLKKKIDNSTWKALPLYSGLSRDKWQHALQKASFIKELWPAQHLLGQAKVLKGKSAIVQMPTSAGKTKATELILRSAFLADRVSLAVIIAPFRALCHEIKDSLIEAFQDEPIMVEELSDTLQTDFEIGKLLGHHQVVVVTPEKLVYVLRHSPDLAAHIGLLVFDEGHQFDSGTRGITYELLLTSLRTMISESAQKVLISAVISNATAVGEWLNGESNVVEGNNLIPTFRSVGFASWLDQLGRIEYVDSRDAEHGEFFVPRVIERFRLGKKKGERAGRFFPDKNNAKSIALYLGLKLVSNGSIAIFCGTKVIATSLCEMAVDIIGRGSPLDLPSKFSDAKEVARLKYLHDENLGADAPVSNSAAYGIYFHHGNIPHGIRLAVEHAMRDDLVRFVVCTSTLAQGVNLPIRYLIMTNLFQGKEGIKVRDFHNLIGRAGRAGMYTEGSILFANPVLYDKRNARDGKRHWDYVKILLEPSNSEPCISNLLSIFDPIKLDGSTTLIDGLDFAKDYINNPDEISKLVEEPQVAFRIDLICAVESFLLAHWAESANGLSEVDATRLAEKTLAFFLADDQKKEHIRELFRLLTRNISAKIVGSNSGKIYGKTLYGLHDAKSIEIWVNTNAEYLLSIDDEGDIFEVLWPLIAQHVNRGICSKFDKPTVLKEIAYGWISGISFSGLLEIIHNRKAKMKYGKKKRAFKIDHVVEICEGALAFDGALVVSAVCEFIENAYDETGNLLKRLQIFQKRLKYGLPTATTIALYELGFSDRVIAQNFAIALNLAVTQKKDILHALKMDYERAKIVMEKFPSYFQKKMDELLYQI